MKKRIILFFLTLLLIAILFTACSETESSSDSDTLNDVTETEGETTTAGPWVFGDIWETLNDDLPNEDFGGAVFNILTMDYEWHDFTVIADEMNGDVLNDAIFKRTSEIEEKYNVDITSTLYTDFWSTAYVKTLVASGDPTYNLIWMIERFALSAAMENCLYPLMDIPYVDLSRPYWGGDSIISALTINGTQYFGVPDYNLIGYNVSSDIMFNKTLHSALQLENIYDLVLDGKWTYDKLLTMAQAAVMDLNGNGEKDMEDQFGIACVQPYLVYNFWNSANVFTVVKDSNDLPYYALPGNEKANDIYEKVFKDYYEPGIFMKSNEIELFQSGRALFQMARLWDVLDLRDMKDDYGLLPLAKYDEKQDEYYTPMESLFFTVVPTTVANLDLTGIILEAMACASYNTVIPEYYEKCLTTKFVRDDESAEVIGLILKNRVVDFGNVYFSDDINSLVFSDIKLDYVSSVEKLSSKINSNLDKAIEFFQQNNR